VKMAELGGLTTAQLVMTTAEQTFTEQCHLTLISAMVFGTLLLLQGNQQNQNDISHGVQRQGNGNQKFDYNLTATFLEALQFLLREIRQRVETQRVTQGRVKAPNWMLVLAKQLLTFLAALAFGENASVKDFLRRQKGRDSTNIVMETSQLISCVCSLTTTCIIYLDDPVFEKIAPEIPGSNGRSRNFFAWHNYENDYVLIIELIELLGAGFRALSEFISGPNTDNQIICRRAATVAPDLLEFMGSLHLRLPTKVQGEEWCGDDPYSFYSILVSNIEKHQSGAAVVKLNSDPKIKEFLLQIQPAKDPLEKVKKRSCFGKKAKVQEASRVNDYLGIDVDALILAAAKCENELLTLTLGLVDGQDPTNFTHFLECWPLLLQNMNSTLILGRAAAGQSYHDSQVSGYLTLLNWVVSSFAEDSEGKTLRLYLQQWEKGITEKIGMPLRDIISSVEVNSKDEKLIRIYFPVPGIVQMHWTLPEIQNEKKVVLYSVNRDTPEERVQDFYKKRNIVMDALKMQALISRKMGFMHMFFGGRSPGWMAYFPSQRGWLLCQTLFQNIFLLYEKYQDDYPLVSDDSVLNTIKNWEYEKQFWYFLGVTHSLNVLSLLIQFVLNSTAICSDFNYRSRYEVVRQLIQKPSVQIMVRLVGALYEAKWMSLMMFFSLMGMFDHLWYAFAVMDVVFQIRMMSFLLESITRNLTKLTLTILLSFVVLYIISLVAYILFTDEYSLADQHDCQTLINCFMLHVAYGWLESPVWDSEGMINPYLQNSNSYSPHYRLTTQSLYTGFAVFFQVMYVIVVNLVLSAIISGLIIDTFSEMRSENESIESDIVGNCFICGIDRDDFERAGVNFNGHTTHDHNMWKYLQLELYLEQKDKGTYTGQDIYLAQMFSSAENFVSLMPVKKAMILESQKLKEKNDLATLFSKVTKIDKKADTMVKEQVESLSGLDLLHAAHKERKRENKLQSQEMNRLQKNQEKFETRLKDLEDEVGYLKTEQAEILKIVKEEQEARIRREEEEKRKAEEEERERNKGIFG